jgi:TRAP-type C4-dicarboxylate transport system permease small subunit
VHDRLKARRADRHHSRSSTYKSSLTLFGRLLAASAWLALPVALLLFLQWPLRDLVQAYSREANDLAQWMFALYIALAVVEATRRGTHLHSDAIAQRFPPALRDRVRRYGTAICIAPWALVVLVTATPVAWQSLRDLERFPETFNPGYFIIKLAVWLFALLLLAQVIVDAIASSDRTSGERR